MTRRCGKHLVEFTAGDTVQKSNWNKSIQVHPVCRILLTEELKICANSL